ncbi:MAG: hypothetical protein KDD90_09390, partial [Sphingomonadaceae bacterium]|nr:hypothetical protein [Sphingomonadaceae bacterium]
MEARGVNRVYQGGGQTVPNWNDIAGKAYRWRQTLPARLYMPAAVGVGIRVTNCGEIRCFGALHFLHLSQQPAWRFLFKKKKK